MLIVDGSHLLHRVRFQLAKTDKKKQTKDYDLWKIFSYTFTRSLLNIVKELKDKDVVVCWDLHGSKRRFKVYKDYKKRDPIDETTAEGKELKKALESYTIARFWLHKAIPKMGFTSLMVDGIEADDIAFWLVNRKFKDYKRVKNYLITEDKDWMQSLRTGWTLYRPISEQKITFENFIERNKIENCIYTKYCNPRVKFVMKKAFDGDKSDNIIGCTGVGEVKGNEYSSKLLKKEPFNMKYKVAQNIEAFINNGELSKNMELIDFRMITRSERRKISIAFDESKKLVEEQNFMTWVQLADEIDSVNMVNFGGEYLEGS